MHVETKIGAPTLVMQVDIKYFSILCTCIWGYDGYDLRTVQYVDTKYSPILVYRH
jgi:hypothetical protein